MRHIKHHTSKPLKIYLAENFKDKKFCVIDLHPFADMHGIPYKALTYSVWYLSQKKVIKKFGERQHTHGGSPFNYYIYCKKQPKKQEVIKSKKNDSISKMTKAANRLDSAFSFKK